MPFVRFPKALLLAVLAGALVGCENAGTLAGGGPRSDYLVARTALENGNYPLAIRRYETLIDRVGPGASARLQLEYAHSLLRASRYDDAIQATASLAERNPDSIQASALAVRGTARHEAAREFIERGESDEARALLEAARADLDRFLDDNAALDAAGSMRARTELIAADLRSLG
ncbi:MAG: Tetratricopeptide repeat [Rhodobacteraceae bacterium HLUCCA12]|nr:MAG: Tetratricopeptide repeat [Rhodobacteraceae bacterium HLUCCA12]